ncbi:hypothetical protein M5689_005374 [Euphorbia peplus]|nr:hypothetical protein M5689_005374 [Euphorbia peplus]
MRNFGEVSGLQINSQKSEIFVSGLSEQAKHIFLSTITFPLNHCYNFHASSVLDRVSWVQLGDGNTAYFFRQFKIRSAQKRILRIQDAHGQVFTDSDEIGKTMVDFYKSLLGSSDITV